MKLAISTLLLCSLPLAAHAVCPSTVTLQDTLSCSSSIVSQTDHTQPSYLGGECSGGLCYQCGDPWAEQAQIAPEAVYSFTCQVDGQVTLLITNLPCDLDIYVLDDSCDPYNGCVDGSTASFSVDDSVEFTCQAGMTYYIVVEAYGVSHLDVASGPCTDDGTATGTVFSPSYTLSFDVSAGTGCPEDCDDGLDNDFSGAIDCSDPACGADPVCCDLDGDGFFGFQCGGPDCDDDDGAVTPDSNEVANGIDDDCDGTVDEGTDAFDDDGDGYSEDGGDCDDGEAAIHPGAPELANGVDDDCDGAVDEGTTASDDDGDGYSEEDGDCNDGNAAIHPGAPELANGIDDDCDGVVDEGTIYSDDDGDGYTENDGDCDDTNAAIHPGAPELPNGLDDDCDGITDEGTNISDDDGDGFSELQGDCDDADPDVSPDADEIPGNEVDEDCDGVAEPLDEGHDDVAADDDDDAPPVGVEIDDTTGTPELGCSCDASGGAGWLLLPLLGLRRRRT